jgi:hypothetical protein
MILEEKRRGEEKRRAYRFNYSILCLATLELAINILEQNMHNTK